MRVAFLGSPPFATPILARLIETRFRPVVVVTQPDRPRGRGRHSEMGAIAALVEEHGLPLLQPESTRDAGFAAALRTHALDALLVASYGEILREEILSLPARGAYNVHASLLPRWRGASPVQMAILHGDRDTGVSVQRMVLALDEGDVVVQKRTAIDDEETAGELVQRLALLGAAAAYEALELVAADKAVYKPQDPALATICRKLSKESGRIDWSRPAPELARLVRAMHPWPMARTRLSTGDELSVLRARVATSERTGNPGEVLEAHGRLVVACADGALELLQVQSAGRKALDAASWLSGARLTPGTRLLGPGEPA